jgi:peptidyl-prolyl cis-trans isomerase D
LAEVRDQVRQRLVAQRSADLARTTGAKQLDAWKSGADAAGLSAALVVSRDNAQGLSGPVLNAALSADPKQLPAWVGVDLGEQGYAVVKVDKVLPRQPRDGQAKMQEVQQYSQWWSSAESSAYYDTLKERFKVRIKVPAPKPVVAPAR